ncbi:MAG: hypothetical protein OXC44_04525, partial [Proteobacteria bacterium]|nr:hypothetical protein [Pseudomonadota bacterium]
MLSCFYLLLPPSFISVSYAMLFRLVTTFVLCCLLVAPFHSMAFSQDNTVRHISGPMPKESVNNLSEVSSRTESRKNDTQLQRGDGLEPWIIDSEDVEKSYHRPVIDMVWFVDHPMGNQASDTGGRSFVKNEINHIIDELKDHVELKVALYAFSTHKSMFSISEIRTLNNNFKKAYPKSKEKNRFFKFGNFFEPSQLLRNAYLWLTFGIPAHYDLSRKQIIKSALMYYNRPFSFSYINNSSTNSENKRDGFFRGPQITAGRVYKKIFVFVTSEDSRRYSAKQSNKAKYFDEIDKDSIRRLLRGSDGRLGSEILFLSSSGLKRYYTYPSVFSSWSVMALLGGVYPSMEQPSLGSLLAGTDMTNRDAIKDKLKSQADSRIKKATEIWNINKYSLHMNNEDFISEIMGTKEAYEGFLKDSNKPVRAMFPVTNPAEIHEYLYTLKNSNKDEENNIEKIDVWSFVFDGFSSGAVGKRDELIACSSTPPPPPP